LVEALSLRWGTRQTPSGKAVWATLALTESPRRPRTPISPARTGPPPCKPPPNASPRKSAPRVIGGHYRTGLVGEAYTVLAIHPEPVWPIHWPGHTIVRRHIDGLVIVRCTTPWDSRYDRALEQSL
jgi:hypothetical protein